MVPGSGAEGPVSCKQLRCTVPGEWNVHQYQAGNPGELEGGGQKLWGKMRTMVVYFKVLELFWGQKSCVKSTEYWSGLTVTSKPSAGPQVWAVSPRQSVTLPNRAPKKMLSFLIELRAQGSRKGMRMPQLLHIFLSLLIRAKKHLSNEYPAAQLRRHSIVHQAKYILFFHSINSFCGHCSWL